MKPFTIKIRDKQWRIVWKSLPKKPESKRCWGICEKETRTIILDPRMEDFTLMDTWIHEVLHAWMWEFDEDAVEAFAGVATRGLRKLGFHRDED